MRAFGLNLAESAARALQDNFVRALPYLILVGIVVASASVGARRSTISRTVRSTTTVGPGQRLVSRNQARSSPR